MNSTRLTLTLRCALTHGDDVYSERLVAVDCGGGADASGVQDLGGADAVGGARPRNHGRLPGGQN